MKARTGVRTAGVAAAGLIALALPWEPGAGRAASALPLPGHGTGIVLRHEAAPTVRMHEVFGLRGPRRSAELPVMAEGYADGEGGEPSFPAAPYPQQDAARVMNATLSRSAGANRSLGAEEREPSLLPREAAPWGWLADELSSGAGVRAGRFPGTKARWGEGAPGESQEDVLRQRLMASPLPGAVGQDEASSGRSMERRGSPAGGASWRYRSSR